MPGPERDSWAVMNGATRVVDAEDSRLGIGALWTPGASAVRARQGIRAAPGTPGKVTVTGTPDKNVVVSKFQAVVTASRGLGEYIATLDADKTLDLLTANPVGALPRWDLIIAVQTDTFYTDGSSSFLVRQVVGTPNAAPVDPSLAAFSDYIVLERVRFPANATVVQDSYLDHLPTTSVPQTVALGGILPVWTQAERDALAAYNGMTIRRMDKGWNETYSGVAWRVPNFTTVAALADITHPLTLQTAILNTDNKIYRWSGSAWVEYGVLGVMPGGEWLITGTQTIPTGGADSKISAAATVQGTASYCTYAGGALTLSLTGIWTVSFALEVTNATNAHWAWLSDNAAGTTRYCGSSQPGGFYSGSVTKKFTSGTVLAIWAWAELASDLVTGRNGCRLSAQFVGSA